MTIEIIFHLSLRKPNGENDLQCLSYYALNMQENGNIQKMLKFLNMQDDWRIVFVEHWFCIMLYAIKFHFILLLSNFGYMWILTINAQINKYIFLLFLDSINNILVILSNKNWHYTIGHLTISIICYWNQWQQA